MQKTLLCKQIIMIMNYYELIKCKIKRDINKQKNYNYVDVSKVKSFPFAEWNFRSADKNI